MYALFKFLIFCGIPINYNCKGLCAPYRHSLFQYTLIKPLFILRTMVEKTFKMGTPVRKCCSFEVDLVIYDDRTYQASSK